MNYLIRNILYSTIAFFTIFYGIGKLMIKEDGSLNIDFEDEYKSTNLS